MSDADGTPTQGPSNFAAAPFASETLDALVQRSSAVALSGQVASGPVERIRNLKLVSVPIELHADRFDSLTAAVIIDPNRSSSEQADLTVVAAHASLWHERNRHAELQEQLTLTAATIDLLATIDQADNFRAAAIGVANALRDHFDCRSVVLGMRKKSSSRLQIAGMSGIPELDNNAAFTTSLQDALDETILRDRLTTFPSSDVDNRDTLLSHQRLATVLQATQLVSFPLKDVDEEIVGAWMAIDDRVDRNERLKTLMRAAAPRVADALSLAQRADRSLLQRAGKSTHRGRSVLTRTGIAALVAAGIMAIPVPYHVHCQCAAEPELRRFIVAPHEGLLEKTFVQPGDLVSVGDRLAQMDGRDVRWELSGLVAEREKATQQRDSFLIQGDVASAQRASLELRRIASREHLLRHRQSKLNLTSPIDGIVLDGHLDRVENAPVTIGQALYEVAPLDQVVVEIAIPDDEYSHVEVGNDVKVRFDGVEKDFDGRIRKIHPKTEVRDGDNVFVAEVVLDNAGEGMRPGMNGYARVKSKTHSLGWNLLHKPWEHFRQSLPF
jgi:multidrug resistance efflux pump